ncbi:MAG: hypothetical protein J5674_02265, partial [Candidatus Methanomethylophilaceae archaeon]|nr:hypothetical protein [Candidatus Methanomethylophilaceae archaeon]
ERPELAFKDFEISTAFLDEESLDEFMDLVMDTSLESVERSAEKGEAWLERFEPLFGFEDALEDRFGDLLEIGFVEDLVSRIGYLDLDSDLKARMAAVTAADVAFAYSAFDLYLPDHQGVMEASAGVLRSIEADEGLSAGVRMLAGTLGDTMERMMDIEMDACRKHGEDGIDALCNYWVEGSDGHEDMIMDMFLESVKFATSNKRNKGAKKKADKAADDYRDLLEKTLSDGTLDDYRSSRSPDGPFGPFDGRECPECGRFVPAGPGGVIQCGCGFKGRIVTEAIDDLPEDLESLHAIAGRAFSDLDSEALNNVGERILDIDDKDWRGCVALAWSCVLDGNLAVALGILMPCMEHIGRDDAEEFSDKALELISQGISDSSSEDDALSLIPLSMVLASFPGIEDQRPVALRLLERIKEKGFGGFASIGLASMIPSTIVNSLGSHTYPLYEVEDVMKKILDLQEAAHIAAKDAGVPETDDGLYVMRMLEDNIGSLKTVLRILEERSGKEPMATGDETYEEYLEVLDAMTDFFKEDDSRGRDPSRTSKAEKRLRRSLEGYLQAA